jgi:hypothetical protein
MADDSEYLVQRMRAIRRAIDAMEDAPPHSDYGAKVLGDLEDYLRETDTDLRHERTNALEEIADAMLIAGRRLKEAIVNDDLGDGVGFSTIDLSSLGTLFGHFDSVYDAIPEEWRVE